MSDKFFLDTNVFVYSRDDRDPRKQQQAIDLMRRATVDRAGIISYQVVQEFFNVVLVKAAKKMTLLDAQEFLATVFRPILAVHSSAALFSEGIRLQEQFKLSWYDSLIVAAALQAECELLYTEDLQDGQRFEALTVRNPFR
jgi:predicted nucleic acid-binding protein